jgi:hypothetical protein
LHTTFGRREAGEVVPPGIELISSDRLAQVSVVTLTTIPSAPSSA